MDNLICLLKGCGIETDKSGRVRCPDCKLVYCWDRRISTSVSQYMNRSTYPFGKWVPCSHGELCLNRRTHKNRNDSPSSYIKNTRDQRHARLKLPLGCDYEFYE